MRASDLPAPETLDASPVLISRPLTEHAGEQPGHAVVCDRGVWSSAPFETWLVRSGDGGRSWHATPGGTWGTLVEAQADLLALAPDEAAQAAPPAPTQRRASGGGRPTSGRLPAERLPGRGLPTGRDGHRPDHRQASAA